MNDEYVDEIRKIREKSYEVIKDMTSSEMSEYFHKSAEQFERRVAKCRERKASEAKTAQLNATDR